MQEPREPKMTSPVISSGRFNLLDGSGGLEGDILPIGKNFKAILHPIDKFLETKGDKALGFNLDGGEVLEGTPIQVVRAGSREEHEDYLIVGSPSQGNGQPPKIHVLKKLPNGTFESKEIPRPSPEQSSFPVGEEIKFGRSHSNSPTAGTVSSDHFTVAMIARESIETRLQVTTMATTNDTYLLTPEESGILGEMNALSTERVGRVGGRVGELIGRARRKKSKPEIEKGRPFEQHMISPDGGLKSFPVGPGTNQNPMKFYKAWGNQVGDEVAGRIIGSFTLKLSPLGPPRGDYVLIDMTDLPVIPEEGLEPDEQVLRQLPNGETVRGDVALYGEVLGRGVGQERVGSLCVIMGKGKNTIFPQEFTPQETKGAFVSDGPALMVQYDPEANRVTITNISGPQGRLVKFYTPTDPENFGLDRYGEPVIDY